jgi:hypothetical protein
MFSVDSITFFFMLPRFLSCNAYAPISDNTLLVGDNDSVSISASYFSSYLQKYSI